MPIRDHDVIGDGHTAALVSKAGPIGWWCAPRFDSPPILDAILGGDRRIDLLRLRESADGHGYDAQAISHAAHPCAARALAKVRRKSVQKVHT